MKALAQKIILGSNLLLFVIVLTASAQTSINPPNSLTGDQAVDSSSATFTFNSAPFDIMANSTGFELRTPKGEIYTPATAGAVGWIFTMDGSNFMLNVLSAGGHAGPTQTLVGSNANGSTAASGPHNPLMNQSIIFVFGIPGVTTGTGTQIADPPSSSGTSGTVGQQLAATPEPPTVFLILGGMLAIAIVVFRSR